MPQGPSDAAAAAAAHQPTVCVAGTYDGGIVGWELRESSSAAGRGNDGKLQMVFAYTPHQGSIRALTIPTRGPKAGALLVSGGSDEHIRLYDLRKRAESGELLHHRGTVTCLGFVGSTHLLSGSDDGTVCIWRVYDWSLLHVLGGHKGPVTALAVHPSGKLALTTGRDRSLRLWDLVNGRCAYITKLDAPADSVKWSGDGLAYALVIGDKRLEVRRASDNVATAVLQHPLRVTALAFLPDAEGKRQHVLTACDDGRLRVVDGADGAVVCEVATAPQCGRVKEAVLLHCGHPKEELEKGKRRVVTASSDGRVVVWSVDVGKGEVVAGPAASLGDGVRITCLAAFAAGGSGEGEAEGGMVGAGQKGEKKKEKRKHAEQGKGAKGPGEAVQKREGEGKGAGGKKKRPVASVSSPANREQQQQQQQRKKHKPQHPQQRGQPGKEVHQAGGKTQQASSSQKQQKHKKQGAGGGGRAKSEGGVVSFL